MNKKCGIVFPNKKYLLIESTASRFWRLIVGK